MIYSLILNLPKFSLASLHGFQATLPSELLRATRRPPRSRPRPEPWVWMQQRCCWGWRPNPWLMHVANGPCKRQAWQLLEISWNFLQIVWGGSSAEVDISYGIDMFWHNMLVSRGIPWVCRLIHNMSLNNKTIRAPLFIQVKASSRCKTQWRRHRIAEIPWPLVTVKSFSQFLQTDRDQGR